MGTYSVRERETLVGSIKDSCAAWDVLGNEVYSSVLTLQCVAADSHSDYPLTG